jgi:hypothetical protein
MSGAFVKLRPSTKVTKETMVTNEAWILPTQSPPARRKPCSALCKEYVVVVQL